MFDHVKFGVSDHAPSKTFFPETLSSSARTGTTSKRFATNPTPDPSAATQTTKTLS
jgi:hypothetical protein